ncbi:class II aldolase/adducin family protein, partial [Sphingopyxis terrae]|uniref:class II aldolase/adducin family protein n=1 Tax=Sphingopyxis terrae TaxID=33052 RepID=UPI003F7CF5FB
MTEDEARQQLVDGMRSLDARGLNRGSSGNLSVRFGSGMFVTPSGVTPDRLTPDLMVFVDADGRVAPGAAKPSSEWRMHMGLYQRRADAQAIVHCHARHSTILACAHREIPPLHYMVAVGGGASVPVAPYATFG